MNRSETANNGVDELLSDIDDETYLDDGDEDPELNRIASGVPGEENGSKAPVDGNSENQSPTRKSNGSSLRSVGKRSRAKRQPLYSLNVPKGKPDTFVDAIVESRKFNIIENAYTRLAQSISDAPRLEQDEPGFDMEAILAEEGRMGNRGRSGVSSSRILSAATTDLDNDEFEEGSTVDPVRGSTPINKRSCQRVYESTCERLNVFPCSLILRNINTTKMNLANYGLGPRGCAALAAGLVKNTTVSILNLSGNSIGSGGMSHIYQIMVENTYIEEYDLSFNNLRTQGICKLAAALADCGSMTTLNVAGNELNANDIQILLKKLEDRGSVKYLNISHNLLDEDGGLVIAKWLIDNNTVISLDASWCSIRLSGAKAVAKSIGDNNKLNLLDLSHNSFTNDTADLIAKSLIRNATLSELNLRGNQFISRHDGTVKSNPSCLITGKDCHLYKMMVSAATNDALKIFRLGRNHIDGHCLMIMLRALAVVNNVTLKELDLTGLTLSGEEISEIASLFSSHPNLTCYVGPIRHTIEYFVNNLLDSIRTHCQKKHVSICDIFDLYEGFGSVRSTMTHEQFINGLRKAEIPFQLAQIDAIMKYLESEDQPGMIPIGSLNNI